MLDTTSSPSVNTIVFLDKAPIPDHIQLRPINTPHTWHCYDSTEYDERLTRLKDATIAITNKVPLDAQLLAQLPHLKFIAVCATGFNHVDVEYCQRQGIQVSNIRDYANQSVSEHVFAMIFSLRRQLNQYQRDIASGLWQSKGHFCFFTHPIRDVAGATLTIIGSGSLGHAVANMANALGMTVIFAERKGMVTPRDGYVNFEQAIKQADVLSIHCPLNPNTVNLIDEHIFALMKPSALLINTARGGIVNEEALINALITGKIAGAGMDVCTEEPPSLSHPFMGHVGLPNLLLSPHIAWGSDSALQCLADQLIDNIEAYIAGTPQHRVV